MLSSVRRRLILLVLITAIPLILATLLVIARFADAHSKAQELTLVSSTRALAAAVDAELKKYVTLGNVLGTSLTLQTKDYVNFYDQAKAATAHLPGTWVVVADVAGQQLLNTLRPFGEPLPMVAPPDLHRRALETRMHQVGDVGIGPVAKRSALGILVPVFRDDEPQFDIVIGLDPHVFTRILDEQKFPAGWLAGIADRKGNFVARSIDNDLYLVKPVSEGWRKASQNGDEGVFDSISKEGIPLHSAYRNIANEWSVSVGASRAVLRQSFHDSILLVAFSSVGLIGLALGLAWIAARPVIASMQSLESASLSLLQNKPVVVSRTGLREVDNAVVGFESASYGIIEREERQQLLMKELNHRVKNLFAVIRGIVSLSVRSAHTPQELATAIRGRLDALACAHDMVLPNVDRSKILPRSTPSD